MLISKASSSRQTEAVWAVLAVVVRMLPRDTPKLQPKPAGAVTFRCSDRPIVEAMADRPSDPCVIIIVSSIDCVGLAFGEVGANIG